VTPSWYRELNIMNSVLNKDFVSESCLNSALIVFSDVFRPASCMQSSPQGKSGSLEIRLTRALSASYADPCTSRERRT
jgi:hypothetical protein